VSGLIINDTILKQTVIIESALNKFIS